MSYFPSKTLVEEALKKRSGQLNEAIAAASSITLSTESDSFDRAINIYGQVLQRVNNHITIKKEIIEEAIAAYNDIGAHLITELDWDENDIAIRPQGSAATQTLIRYPGRKDFDIDAVCEVNIDRVDAKNPVKFFQDIGEVLKKKHPGNVKPKNRCWNINFVDQGFYLEFTPSVPLVTEFADQRGTATKNIATESGYEATALSVVDNKEKWWKPSNPEGFAQWVSDTARLQLLKREVAEAALSAEMRVEPVPAQEVGIQDTLRTAIRLFKRHRDMCVRRNLIPSEYQPISVILVTLVTGAYEGLARVLGVAYEHPVSLMADLAEILPHMVERREDEWWVPNPTVQGENFAEKWNLDREQRKKAFAIWCECLTNDLQRLLNAKSQKQAQEIADDIFGTGSNQQDPGNGSVPPKPKYPGVIPVKPNNGLA